MANGISKLLIFAAGAAIGSLVTYKVVKDKYESTIEQEIDEIKEYYKEKSKKEKPQEEVNYHVQEEEKEDKNYYEEIVSTKGYFNYSEIHKKGNEVELADGPDPENRLPEEIPYIISIEEFGEEPSYDTATLYWYEDDVLCDDLNEPVDDPDFTVGDENLDIFRDSAHASALYVRNDALRCDFEVLRDGYKSTDYKDDMPQMVTKDKKPHQL